MDYKLTYKASGTPQDFVTYCDASHGDCPDTGRSTGGYVTMVAGAALGWAAKLQPFVTLSTTEAEYVSACEAGKEIKWTSLRGPVGMAIRVTLRHFLG